MKISTDFLIIGAGIVGLTVAYELTKKFPKSSILILEKENEIGLHASGRNSGVLHSGVYYGADTLKAKVCSKGAKSMMAFADEYRIPYKKNGKVIIAKSEADFKVIDNLIVNAKKNKVKAEKLNSKEIKEIEPYSSPYEYGIYSPDTAVIDSNEVIQSIKKTLINKKVKFLFSVDIEKINPEKKCIYFNHTHIYYNLVYNCAGTGADEIAKKYDLGHEFTLIPFKGLYYKLDPRFNFMVNGNIYPVPDPNQPFLGVHFTKNIHGDIYIGPTAIPALGKENYSLLEGINFKEAVGISFYLMQMFLKNHQNFRKSAFSEIRKYSRYYFFNEAKKLVNSLELKNLIPSEKIGIRPQLINKKTKKLEMDYIILKGNNSVNVLNSISPAFTSSFEFAKYIIS
jgi:L-2-hydroxyglutarate oxidase LhgO